MISISSSVWPERVWGAACSMQCSGHIVKTAHGNISPDPFDIGILFHAHQDVTHAGNTSTFDRTQSTSDRNQSTLGGRTPSGSNQSASGRTKSTSDYN